MIKKAFDVIKNNPVLVAMYLGYMAVILAVMYIALPNGITQSKNTAVMLGQIGKLYLYLGVIGLIGLFFISGAGAMITEAVMNGKTSIASFLPGVKKFFWRMVRSALLLFAIIVGASIVLSIVVTISIAMITVSAGQHSTAGVTAISTIIVLGIMMIAVVLILPFLMLWIPALFIDDLKVTQALGTGAKAAKKNYGKLVLIMLATLVPSAGYFVYMFTSTNFSEAYKTMGNMQNSPAYYIELIVSFIIATFILPMLFILYNEYKLKTTPMVEILELDAVPPEREPEDGGKVFP